MQLSSLLLALAAAASSALAQTAGFDVFTNPITPGTVIPAGKSFTIRWDPSPAPLDGKVTIQLLQGKTNTSLQIGDSIAIGIDGAAGSYVWDVLTSTPSYPLYGFKLLLDSQPSTFQFSTFFSISGLSGGSSGSGSGSGASSTATIQVSSVHGTTTPSPTPSGGAVTGTGSGASASGGGTYSNTTITTTAATTGSKTQTTASGSGSHSGSGSATQGSATKSPSPSTTPNAAAPAVIGASGLIGAVFVAFGLLL